MAVSDVFLINSIGTGIGKLAVSGAEKLAAKEGGKYLYHYTSKEAAQSISNQGLKVGRDGFSYLTNKDNLSGIQAQIELALPANRMEGQNFFLIKRYLELTRSGIFIK